MTDFTVTDFRTDKKTVYSQADIEKEAQFSASGHGGGDWMLAHDWCLAVDQQNPGLLTSTIDASIESHIMGFMAEKSRAKKKVLSVRL